jgi:hypothetical protein
MRHATPVGQALAGLAALACFTLVGLSLDLAPAHSYSSGAPAGFSGPENYCNACHGGPDANPVNSGDGAVTITAPETFTPGEAVPVTVTVEGTAPPPARRGFELSARDGALGHVGGFVVDGTAVQFAQGDSSWVTHTSSSNAGASWTFAWVPPATGAPDEVTLYVAGNAADGDFIPDADDEIYADTHVLTRVQQPAVVAALAPVSPPVVLGPGGGSFPYRATLTNTTGQQQAFDAWTMAVLPNGNPYGPVEGPRRVRLGPGQTLGPLTLRLNVPGAAPAGTYTYRLLVGQYPGAVISEDGFTFQKQGAAGSAAGTILAGEGAFFDAAATRPSGPVLAEAAPNPFSVEARLTLALAEAEAVRVAVFDALGRRVAVLHDGPLVAGTHALVLDGRGLPEGVYIVRVVGGSFRAARRVTLAR